MFYARLFIAFIMLLAQPARALPGIVQDQCADKITVSKIEAILKAELALQEQLDTRLSDALQSVLAEPATLQNKDLDKALDRAHGSIESNHENFLENKLRISFLSDLRDKIIEKKVCVLRPELPEILTAMAKRELLGCAEVGKTAKECGSWKFMTNLALVIKDNYEISEDFGEFLKSFMVYSTINNPKSPGEFIRSRSYIGK